MKFLDRKIDITTHYNWPSKFYFEKIINEVIKIGNLFDKNKKILDFGCGEKYLQKKLKRKIYNYDINPKYNEISNWEKLIFDYVIFNAVIMYFDKYEFINILNQIKTKNPNCEIIICMSKETILNRLLAYMCFRFDWLKNTKLSYENQIQLIEKNLYIKKKINIWGLSEVLLCSF